MGWNLLSGRDASSSVSDNAGYQPKEFGASASR